MTSPIDGVFRVDWRNTDIHVNPNAEWWFANRFRYWCRHCSTLDRRHFPTAIDVTIERAAAKRSSITIMSRLSIGLIRQDVRSRLEPWLGEFVFGKCFDYNGYLIHSHSTFYCAPVARVRAGPGSSYRACSACGTIWRNQLVGSRYLVQSDIGSRRVVQDLVCSTYVTRDVVDAAGLDQMRDVELVRFPVLETPIDGVLLPGDPPGTPAEPPEVF